MVFQEFDQLLPWKTVKQNVMFPLDASGTPHGHAPREERAMHYIEKVNLDKFADSYPHTLSGGMKQRVAIARGMAMEPDILLMDEPFAALDALTRRKMQDELLQLWDDTQFTVLFVTHSIPEADAPSATASCCCRRTRVRSRPSSTASRATDPMRSSASDSGTDIHDMLFADEVETEAVRMADPSAATRPRRLPRAARCGDIRRRRASR